ncbi:odorant receptor 9a-like [Chelonus insularis]|uniref:odorant receptor 9a-like n=1 Tax=Chelonus insularis TaxID=460826 RepID=UPI00158CC54C|nr:odorant receptor 9a-like [Chelonus insularis]
MTEITVANYLAYRKFNRRLLPFIGWSKQNTNKINRCIPHIQLYLSLSMAFFLLRYVKVHCDSIATVTRSLSVMTGFFTISMKMVCLIVHQKEVSELQEVLDEYFVNLLKRKEFSSLILKKLNIYRFLTWNLIIFLLMSTCILLIIPAYTIIYNGIHHVDPSRLILVYPTSYPWTVPLSGLIFHLHFVYECLATVAIFTITVSVDSLFLFYVFLIIGQLREISYYITHVDEKNNPEIIIQKCVIQYSILIKCRDNMEKIYGPIVLSIMVTNAIVLCTLIHQMTKMKIVTIVKAMHFFAYITMKVTQTFMYSWCGTQLKEESENFREAIYAANWYGNKRFMTSIIIMLQQRPLVLTACSISVLTVDIFVKILNTTISYYFLIKTLES